MLVIGPREEPFFSKTRSGSGVVAGAADASSSISALGRAAVGSYKFVRRGLCGKRSVGVVEILSEGKVIRLDRCVYVREKGEGGRSKG